MKANNIKTMAARLRATPVLDPADLTKELLNNRNIMLRKTNMVIVVIKKGANCESDCLKLRLAILK